MAMVTSTVRRAATNDNEEGQRNRQHWQRAMERRLAINNKCKT